MFAKLSSKGQLVIPKPVRQAWACAATPCFASVFAPSPALSRNSLRSFSGEGAIGPARMAC